MRRKLVQLALRAADTLIRFAGGDSDAKRLPPHLIRGQKGEEMAYFYLREHGYVVVARNFHSRRHRGEIDLIAWDGDVLCFVEVKTRSSRGFIPAEAAVDSAKQSLLCSTAREYMRRMRGKPQFRFDILSIYSFNGSITSDVTLFKNAFQMS
jgi:putative endonuclease